MPTSAAANTAPARASCSLADGYIVTNTHVLDGAKAVTVTTSDGTEYTGKLVGADAVSDIAVLKIEAQGLTPGRIRRLQFPAGR